MSAIIEAGKAWASARRELQDATGPSLLAAQVAFDWACHELLVALDEPCDCEPGSCPRVPTEIPSL